jgi:hypothetical protein
MAAWWCSTASASATWDRELVRMAFSFACPLIGTNVVSVIGVTLGSLTAQNLTLQVILDVERMSVPVSEHGDSAEGRALGDFCEFHITYLYFPYIFLHHTFLTGWININ